MTRPRSNQRSLFQRGPHPLSARGALLATGLAAAAVWACSSSIDLEPLQERMDPSELQPSGSAGSGSTVVLPTDPGGEIRPTPMLSGTGGAAGMGNISGMNTSAGAGGSAPVASAGTGGAPMMPPVMMGMAGAAPCVDSDGDGKCNDVDRCPDVRDDGTDGDGDGKPDACDGCPQLQDDGRDADGDGTPDACDRCGIGAALALGPLYYLPLDEEAGATTAVNRGTVPINGTYLGPIDRGLAGISDPGGKAIRMAGGANGEFSRVTLLNLNTFPRTSLTATFWIRTTRLEDYAIMSYATQQSQNEFGMVVDAARLRVTLQSATFLAEGLDPAQFSDGAWHFVAFTWAQTVAQFYIDGEAVGAEIRTEPGFETLERASVALTAPPVLRPFGVLVLGQDQDTLNGGFNVAQALVGGLDEVALYDRALTVEELREVFRSTTCGEICDGTDNDGDGTTDEGFLGTAPACGAQSCADILAGASAFGSGEYVSSADPDAPLICNF